MGTRVSFPGGKAAEV